MARGAPVNAKTSVPQMRALLFEVGLATKNDFPDTVLWKRDGGPAVPQWRGPQVVRGFTLWLERSGDETFADLQARAVCAGPVVAASDSGERAHEDERMEAAQRSSAEKHTGIAQRLGRSARGQQFYATCSQCAPKINQSGLVGHRQQSTANWVEIGHKSPLRQYQVSISVVVPPISRSAVGVSCALDRDQRMRVE